VLASDAGTANVFAVDPPEKQNKEKKTLKFSLLFEFRLFFTMEHYHV
jgi:hypothetical protein